jgi:hypothetical protein
VLRSKKSGFASHQVSFVSVTQAFNTTTSMGRLTLNVLLSFAQFEREVTGERIRDKIAASKRKGIWMGGVVPLGYRVENRALRVVEEHAVFVRDLYRRYLEIGSVVRLQAILDHEDARLPSRTDGTGKTFTIRSLIRRHGTGSSFCLRSMLSARPAIFAISLISPAAQSGTQNSASETHFRVRRPRPVVPAE